MENQQETHEQKPKEETKIEEKSQPKHQISKEQLIKQILDLQEEFQNISTYCMDLEGKNAELEKEVSVYQEYNDNLMKQVQNIDPSLLSQVNKFKKKK